MIKYVVAAKMAAVATMMVDRFIWFLSIDGPPCYRRLESPNIRS